MAQVSIIIPTFNRCQILAKTLKSIFNQTYKDYEIIVISNGSTDDTQDVVSCFKDDRLRYIVQKGSGSPASPRNTGIKASRGELIAFCDDDDIWLPDKLEKQVRFLQENLNYDICCTKMKRFDDASEWTNPDEEAKESLSSLDLLYRNSVPLSSLIVRKKILTKCEGLFDEGKEIFGAEDYELILRLSKKSHIFCIQEHLILYYSGINRFSNIANSSSLKSNLRYIHRLYHVYQKVVKKGFFKWSEILLPFTSNIMAVLKIILYDFLSRTKKIFF